MVNVLIVEDSRVVSEYLYYILSQDPQIQVIGNVSNGKKAIEFMREHKPDVISMDIDMPIMDGLEATRIIMSTTPVPILIVTASRNSRDVTTTMEALAAGAVGVIEKPLGIGHPDQQKVADNLVMMIKLMAEVKVVSRKQKPLKKPVQIVPPAHREVKWKDHGRINVVAIGVSSGGPQTLQKVFSKISGAFPVPILVVQHIAEGFIDGLVNWLAGTTRIPMHIGAEGEYLLPGHIYFAPDNHNMGLTKGGKIVLAKRVQKTGLCPTVAHLFTSVTAQYGKSAMGIILTGMGSDGAQELKLMRDAGALTIAQDRESALIYGMPGVAAQLEAAMYILSAEGIGKLLFELETNL